MDLGADLGFAWNFGRNRERVGLVALFGIGALIAVGLFLLLSFAVGGNWINAAGGWQAVMNNSASSFFSGLLLVILLFFALLVILAAVGIWIEAGLLKNAASEYSSEAVSLKQSLDFAKTRFWPLFFASIATLLITIALRELLSLLTPRSYSIDAIFALLFLVLVSWILQILFELFFFFVPAQAVLNGQGAFGAIKTSTDLFFKRPIEVVIFTFLLFLTEIIIILVSLIPIGLLGALAIAFLLLVKGVIGTIFGVALLFVAAIGLLLAVSFMFVFSQGYLAAAFLDLTAQAPVSSAKAEAFSVRKRAAPKPRSRKN